jgi:hypothetical protein
LQGVEQADSRADGENPASIAAIVAGREVMGSSMGQCVRWIHIKSIRDEPEFQRFALDLMSRAGLSKP